MRADDGQGLALWSRVPAQPRGSVLLVHGRTWSSLPNFDLQVPGEPADTRSVLAALARAGYAAYALDLRGYGASARDRSGWNTPDRAAADVCAALGWIAQRHPRLPPPALLGYSNGARIALLVAQAPSPALSALVLYGFPDDVEAPPAPEATPAEPPRVRTTAEAAGSDFLTPGAASPAVRAAYVAQALAADPVRADWRAPEQFAYRPEQVAKVPVLLLRGVDDPLATQPENAHLYARLRSGDRTWVTLPHADHVAHVEDTHAAWVEAVVAFLRRPR
ncbi:alpha/beta hydrolase [Xanthomonas theicola]|uniref:Alpha/beta hydrolase n=1 Tax=Xanthomonas theicola TaxID=56464 RepID=A0A2S6ZBT8_9XANT|nr:alpha/beta hydrolase [Xanthomonas theicola]